jgi:hypothetical protein
MFACRYTVAEGVRARRAREESAPARTDAEAVTAAPPPPRAEAAERDGSGRAQRPSCGAKHASS